MNKHFVIILIIAGTLATFMGAIQMKPGGQAHIPPISETIVIVGIAYGIIYLIVRAFKK